MDADGTSELGAAKVPLTVSNQKQQRVRRTPRKLKPSRLARGTSGASTSAWPRDAPCASAVPGAPTPLAALPARDPSRSASRTPRGCRSSCPCAMSAWPSPPSPSCAARPSSWRTTWRAHPGERPAQSDLRRRAPGQLRPVRHARAQPRLRPQRLRRDAARPLRVGREAPGRELRGGRGAARPGRPLRKGPRQAVRSYRLTMRGLAPEGLLEGWSLARGRHGAGPTPRAATLPGEAVEKAAPHQRPRVEKLTEERKRPATPRLSAAPALPALRGEDGHVSAELDHRMRPLTAGYLDSLGRRDEDCVCATSGQEWGFKVVGVGSVGLQAYVVLVRATAGRTHWCCRSRRPGLGAGALPGAERARGPGERVVVGQRRMQAFSDLFLGWTEVVAWALSTCASCAT